MALRQCGDAPFQRQESQVDLHRLVEAFSGNAGFFRLLGTAEVDNAQLAGHGPSRSHHLLPQCEKQNGVRPRAPLVHFCRRQALVCLSGREDICRVLQAGDRDIGLALRNETGSQTVPCANGVASRQVDDILTENLTKEGVKGRTCACKSVSVVAEQKGTARACHAVLHQVRECERSEPECSSLTGHSSDGCLHGSPPPGSHWSGGGVRYRRLRTSAAASCLSTWCFRRPVTPADCEHEQTIQYIVTNPNVSISEDGEKGGR